ncbi:hypothetical protein V0M98_37720 (plasmid) [Pseudomonas silesiensis]|uniref:hypothetical protein n=1 Tax=Pseudomonas silesiensis TaxID=1853130 RepID=UPI0030CB938A
MFVMSAKRAVGLFGVDGKPKDSVSENILDSTRSNAAFYREHAHETPTDEAWEGFRRYTRDVSGIDFEPGQLEAIFDLYPMARIELAMSHEELRSRDLLMMTISHFFMGCNWPSYSTVHWDSFIDLLGNQAVKLGYTLTPDTV